MKWIFLTVARKVARFFEFLLALLFLVLNIIYWINPADIITSLLIFILDTVVILAIYDF